MTPKYGEIGLEDEHNNLLEHIIIPFGDFAKFLDALDRWSAPNSFPLNYCLFVIRDAKYLSEPMLTNDAVLPDLLPTSFLLAFEKSQQTVEVSPADVRRYLKDIDDTVRNCEHMCVGIRFVSNLYISITCFDLMVGGSPN